MAHPELLRDVFIHCIQDTLHWDLKYQNYHSCKKPLLNDRQKQKRKEFACVYKDWDLEQWRKVLWTDEATFQVTGKQVTRVYRRLGMDPNDPRYTC